MTKLRADGGAVVSLGKQLGSGGEGVVFHINEQPASVAKIYSEALKPRQVAKLKAMVAVADDPLRTVAACSANGNGSRSPGPWSAARRS